MGTGTAWVSRSLMFWAEKNVAFRTVACPYHLLILWLVDLSCPGG